MRQIYKRPVFAKRIVSFNEKYKGRKFQMLFCMLLMLALFNLSSCFLHYYKTNTTHQIDAETIQRLQSEEKVFILHSGKDIYLLTDVKVIDSTIEGNLSTLPAQYAKYVNPSPKKPNLFKGKNVAVVMCEVHLYTDRNDAKEMHVTLHMNDINRMDIYELDKGATNSSTVLSVIGVTIVSVAAIGIIYFLITCNCPQVYAYHANTSEFTGGLYSGAIYASLERTDYMPLRTIEPTDNQLHIKIGNVAGEEQFINEMRLLKVTHNSNEQVLLDRNGNTLVYENPVAPESATIGMNKNIKENLEMFDGKYYSFTNQSTEDNTSNIILDFKKPKGTSSGKLILKARNSSWSGYMFHQFESLFGNKYASWAKKKDQSDAKKMEQWEVDQTLPLMVYIKVGQQWKYIDYFAMPGNTAWRDMILQIDLADLRNEDHIEICLKTAYLLWDMDYAGMDFSQDQPYSAKYLTADKIERSDSTSQIASLSEHDKVYTHLNGNQYLDMQFEDSTKSSAGQSNSYFLVSSGYYHITREMTGTPQVNELKKFLAKGAFDKYSRQKFDGMLYAINKENKAIKN